MRTLPHFTQIENELIRKSSMIFHSFFDRDMDTLVTLLDKNFVWIGSYEFQYTKNLEHFLEITQQEQSEAAAQICDEEYQVLNHERDTWILCGRYTAYAWKDETTYLYSRQRTTLVWKWTGDEFRCIHLHCTMARDVPLEGKMEPTARHGLNLRWYDYMLHVEKNAKPTTENQAHLLLKDTQGSLHYLLPSEVFYVCTEDRNATVYTSTGTIRVHKGLNQLMTEIPSLLQCHKSWLVNPLYVLEIRRYTITLTGGTEIPIGKSRYEEVRDALKKK